MTNFIFTFNEKYGCDKNKSWQQQNVFSYVISSGNGASNLKDALCTECVKQNK